MASKPATMELQDVRALAHKLWGQCRDSPSAYRLLAPSVRKLRNVLEEVEEVLDEGATLGPYELRVLQRMARCKEILCQLDLAFQQYKCSSNKAALSEGTVSDFKTSLDVACHDLSVAQEALSNTGEIQLKLDTRTFSPAMSPSIQSASISASSSDPSRKLSISSSAWSLVNPESSGYGSVTDVASPIASLEGGAGLSEEKEVYLPTVQPLSASNQTVSASINFASDFRDLFMPDPLSLNFEQASHMILGHDVSQDRSMDDNLSNSGPARELSGSGDTAVEADCSAESSLTSEAPAMADAQVRQRSCSEATIAGEQLQSACDPHPEELPLSNTEEVNAPRAANDSRNEHALPNAEIDAVSRDAPVTESPLPDNDDVVRDVSGIAKPITAPVTTTLPTETKPDLPPRPPSRAPPPPPPEPRRTRARARTESRYVIANPTPIDENVSEDSEDELYTTSRPTSPSRSRHASVVEAPQPLCVRKVSGDIPELQVNGTILEDKKVGDKVQDEDSPVIKGDNLAPEISATTAVPSGPAELVQPEPQPPPVPPRPSRYRSTRSASAYTLSTIDVPAIRPEREPGLQVVEREREMGPRKSVDEVLKIGSLRRSTGDRSSSWRSRTWSRSELDSTQVRTADHRRAHSGVVEFYGGAALDSPDTEDLDLDIERVHHIVSSFNDGNWDQAEAYLMAHLEGMIEKDDLASARRARHLLGVCASYKGEVDRAISLFISVLSTPILDISKLDAGDCAAAYWLGDLYAMLNRRTEALLAYCIAERSPLFQNFTQPRLHECIEAEQECCQLGVSKSDFKLLWFQDGQQRDLSRGLSILSPDVVSKPAAKACLDTSQMPTGRHRLHSFVLESSRTRSVVLASLASANSNPLILSEQYNINKIDVLSMAQDGPWPMPYDPLFCMANVARGRLLAYECDLLSVFEPGLETRLPKNGPIGLSRVACFTCNDLGWLIRTIRNSLQTLEMDWSEVANVEGSWFIVRYSFMQKKIAQTHYFSIALYRQTLRSGYGAAICPDGVRAARLIMSIQIDHENGVHHSESHRIRKLIRASLDEAAKDRGKLRKESSPTMSLESSPPPKPLRLKLSSAGLLRNATPRPDPD